MCCRLYRVHSVTSSDCCWDAGKHLRHVGPAQHALPADPAYGSYGPAGRHLETTWFSGLCSQQGGQNKTVFLFCLKNKIKNKNSFGLCEKLKAVK